VGSGQQETNMSLDNTSHPGRAGPDQPQGAWTPEVKYIADAE